MGSEVSVPSSGIMEPTPQEITELMLDSNVEALLRWAGMGETMLASWAEMIGVDPDALKTTHSRMLNAIPDEDYAAAVSSWKIGDNGASLIQKGMAKLAKNAAAKMFKDGSSTNPGDLAAEVASAVASVMSVQPGGVDKEVKPSELRKIKASNVLDPADDSEVVAATADQLKFWYDNYKEIKYGEPLPEKEPSPDQISAMHTRIVLLGLEPYADFSVLTPYGRRMAKILRHRSWIPQEDGTYRPVEVPGPGSFVIWEACWKVYEVILLMLRFQSADVPSGGFSLVVTPIALEAYYEAFKALSLEFPNAWHLLNKAEDRCRAEHFPRLVRRLTSDKGALPSWSQVFTAAAEDDKYWDREVRRPALQFMATGVKPMQAPIASAIQDKMEQSTAAVPSASSVSGNGGSGGNGGKGKRKRTRGGGNGGNRNQLPGPPDPHPNKRPMPRNGSGPHPRKDPKGRYTTTREGLEVCYKFANGGRDACPEPCAAKRAHVCQK